MEGDRRAFLLRNDGAVPHIHIGDRVERMRAAYQADEMWVCLDGHDTADFGF